MVTVENKESKPILKKHVNTIHCSNNLSLVQRKLFNILLYHAYHDLTNKAQYEIPIRKLCSLIGYDSRDYKKLRKSIMDLIVTAIEWNVISNEEGERKEKWQASAIISAAKIENGVCTYEFSSIMRELLHRPDIYGKIDINIMIEFNSGYGLALYENCVRFQGLASTPWLPISVFRKLMGVPESSYQNFCDLKKRVLDIAVREVNQHSPIKVMPELKRVNKKVTSIKFKLVNNQELETEPSEISDTELEQSNLMMVLKDEFSLSKKVREDLLLRHDADYIEEKIKMIKQSESFSSGRIREIGAYLVDALKRDYKANKSSRALMKEVSHKSERLMQNESKLKEEGMRVATEKRKKLVDDFIAALKEDEFKHLITKFEGYLQKEDSFFAFKQYKKVGLESTIIRSIFDNFIENVLNFNCPKGVVA